MLNSLSIITHVTQFRTRSSAVAKSPRNVSCLSVDSFINTLRQAQCYLVSYTLALDLPLYKLNSLLFRLLTGACLCVPQTDLHRYCDTPLDMLPPVDSTSSSSHRSIARYRPTIVLTAPGSCSVHSSAIQPDTHSLVTGRPSRCAAMPVLDFCAPQRSAPRVKFHVYHSL